MEYKRENASRNRGFFRERSRLPSAAGCLTGLLLRHSQLLLSCICTALAGIRGRVAMGVCSPIASVTSTSLLSETHIRRHGTPKVTNQGKVRSFFLKASSLPSGPNSPPRACASTTYLPLSANTHKGTQPISYQRTTQKHYMYHP